MNGRRREARTRRAAGFGALVLLAGLLVPGVAPADRWVSAGVLAGTLQPDPELADYQWSATPRAAWGAQVLAGAGLWAAGARMWSAAHEQTLGLPGAASARVSSTRWELIGRCRVAALWGADVAATMGIGALRLNWQPGRVTVDAPGAGAPVVVELKPVHEWTAGAGMALRRPFAAAWAAGLEIDHYVYRLDTTRREGSGLAARRETLGDWSARLELAWLGRQR